MAKKRKIVGSRNYENKPVSKAFIRLVVEFQKDLQRKENKKKLGKKQKISFVYATLELSKVLKKNKKW